MRGIVFGAFFVFSVSVAAVELTQPAPVMATHFAGVGDDAYMTRCEALPEDAARKLEHQHRRAWSRAQRLERPSPGFQLHSAPPTEDDPYAGIVPADYINPIEHVREVGHLVHEIEVQVTSDADHVRLAEVLDFEAPEWARMMLVEFTPSESASERARPGLFLRPHRPFAEGHFHENFHGWLDPCVSTQCCPINS